MQTHPPYPVILEHAIISRGQIIEQTQDELIGFAHGEKDAAALLSAKPTFIGLVKTQPTAFSTSLTEEDSERAYKASCYWFISYADNEIHTEFGSTFIAEVKAA